MQWFVATVMETIVETARATTLRLDVPGWPGHRAGQHVDVRLTAEDGYQAQRTYSIASPPGTDFLELTVVRIDDGEVSPYLTTDADVGDQFELRGPVGGWFVWDGHDSTTPELRTLADSDHRDVTVTLTRESSTRWTGHRGHVDSQMLGEVGWPPRAHPRCYVCGPSPFVEAVSAALVSLGHEAALVRTERFGSTGG